jgi:hypothetical protein
VFSPPRHQGHQVHPPARFNAKAQRREGAKHTHPPVWPTDHADRRRYRPPTLQHRGAETQRRRGSVAGFSCLARFPAVQARPGIAGSENRVECERSPRFSGPATCALEERRPRHLFSLLNGWGKHAPSPKHEREERQNRRASGTAAGENPANNEGWLSEMVGFSPATGDPIACRSAGIPRPTSLAQQETLCASAPLRGWVDGRALRSLRFKKERALKDPPTDNVGLFLREFLVSWCLGGSKTIQHS